MTETTVGREPVQIVEIVQPLCANTYGSAPCTASGAATEKCYNTRATCQDTSNFDGSSTLSLYFSRGRVAEMDVSGVDYMIPSLASVSTSPTKINLANSNPDAQGLGNRALCSITLKDHPHTDRIVDPYLSDRTFTPYQRGSFWTKWLVRNLYHQNVRINIYEGYHGQALGAMRKRSYFMQSISGPDSNGTVRIEGKDILSKAEARKAQAPMESPGVLRADVTSTDLTLTVTNAVVSEYDASGKVRIGDEIISYSSIVEQGSNLLFHVTSRGVNNTTADSHSFDDRVQQCLEYSADTPDTIIEDLLTTYALIDSSFIDSATWAAEVAQYAEAYSLTAIITKPTSVQKLVSELQEQTGVYVWWDERAQEIKLRVIRGIDSDPDVLTYENHILPGSFSLTELPRQRLSQVWFYYELKNGAANADEVNSYDRGFVAANLTAETDALYGESSIRKIYSRWINTGALAAQTSQRILTRYINNPRQAKFKVDAKDRAYGVGDVLEINHYLDVDQYGAERNRRWTVISWEEVVPGEIVELTCEDTTLYGKIYKIQDNSAVDYTSGDSGSYYAWVTNSDGEYSNGDEGARIS